MPTGGVEFGSRKENLNMLITSIGKAREYRETNYAFHGKSCSSCFSTLAIAQLLDVPREEKILFLVTPETVEASSDIQSQFKKAGYHNLETIRIPHAEDEESIFQIVLTLTDAVAEGEQVILDVTHSFRSLPFVYFVTLLFLHAFKGVSIEGIYYGSFEEGRKTNPIVDLTSLFSMAFWFHAVQTFRETGSVQPLYDIVSREASRIIQRKEEEEIAHKLSALKVPLQNLGLSISFCLPIEMGMDVEQLLQKLDFKSDKGSYEGLLALVFQEISDELKEFALSSKKKDEILLTQEELLREYKIARWYNHHGNPDHTLIILGELMISWMIKVRDMRDWLDYNNTRHRARGILNGMSMRSRKDIGPDNIIKEIGSRWNSIGSQRNEFAHAGFRKDVVRTTKKKEAVDNLCSAVYDLLQVDVLNTIPPKERKKLLIVPFGLSPGVLYSAALLSRFDDLLIIFSEQTRSLLPSTLCEIRKKREVPDQNVFTLLLSDAHSDFIPAKQLKSFTVIPLEGEQVSVEHFLCNYDSVEGCITGGTTAMQYTVERLLDVARGVGVFHINRFALIDRRPPEEQKAHPFVPGQKVVLDQER